MNKAYPYHIGDGRLADIESDLLARVQQAIRETRNLNNGVAEHAVHAAIVRDLCAAMASIRSMRAATPDDGTERAPAGPAGAAT